MPERPDLDYALPILDRELRGRSITGVTVDKPVILRVTLKEPFDALLVGATIERVVRRAHFALFTLGGARRLEMPIAPMLAGRFRIAPGAGKIPADTALTLQLDDGRRLLYRDDVQMGKVFLIEAGAWAKVPGLAKVGVDVLDPRAFTLDVFTGLVRSRRDQVKVFLMDKSALDAMGNAYADEVLFEAKIHPKAMARTLPDDAVRRLYEAIPRVLGDALGTIAARAPATDEKLRDFLKVRGRPGEPCSRCGTKLRKAGVRGHDAIFCPTCQPDRRSSSIVDWSKLPNG